MTNITETAPANKQSQENASAGTRRSGSAAHAAVIAAIFAAALALRLWFNFAADHINCYGSCDASEYLRNARALLSLGSMPADFWSACGQSLIGTAAPAARDMVTEGLARLSEMHQSAPVFPLFILSSFAVAGAPFDVHNWVPPLAAQSLLSALACVLIAFAGEHLWCRRTGYLAGALAAVYPAFIVNSGRLYSESFATFLLAVVIWLAVRGFRPGGNGAAAAFLTGVSAAALQLTRSVMVVVSFALIPLTLIQARGRRPWLAVALLGLGAAFVFLPWLAAQHLAFGKTSVVVDRVGHYNLFTGTNVDTGGWLSYPYPDGRGIEEKSMPALAAENFRKSPNRWLKLMLDKPVRLFKFPWNDFRTAVGPLTQPWQIAIHQWLLLLSAIGITLSLATASPVQGTPEPGKIAGRSFILALLLFHCVYFMFITVPRYNLTAMPEVILFAAAGLAALVRLLPASSGRLIPLLVLFSSSALFLVARSNPVPALVSSGLASPHVALVLSGVLKAFALVLFALTLWKAIAVSSGHKWVARSAVIVLTAALVPALCLPLRAHGRWYEWRESLPASGKGIVQTILLPAENSASRPVRYFLLVDSDGAGNLDRLEFRVNGKPVKGGAIPGLALVPELAGAKHRNERELYRECEYIFDCLSRDAGISNRDLRQWFVLPLPAEALAASASSGVATVEVRNSSGGTADIFGVYRSGRHFIEVPSTTLYSWEKAFYGVETDRGVTDTRYDMRLPAAKMPAEPADGSAGPATYLVRLLSVPEPPQATGTASNEGGMNAAPTTEGNFARNLTVPAGSGHSRGESTPTDETSQVHAAQLKLDADHGDAEVNLTSLRSVEPPGIYLFRVSGKARSTAGSAQAGVKVVVYLRDKTGRILSYTSPWCPKALSASQQSRRFDFTVPVDPAAFPGSVLAATAFFAREQSAGPLRVRSTPDAGVIELQDVVFEASRLPANPLGPGHQVY